MSSDSDSDVCDFSVDVSKFMSKNNQKFWDNYKIQSVKEPVKEPQTPPASQTSKCDTTAEDEYLGIQSPKKNKRKRANDSPTKSPPRKSQSASPARRVLRSMNETVKPATVIKPATLVNPVPSGSTPTMNVLEQVNYLQDQLKELESSLIIESQRPTRKKGKRKQPKRLAKSKKQAVPVQPVPAAAPPDINEISTDEDPVVEVPVELNPVVQINLLWKSVEKKAFKIRKFDKLDVIFEFFVDTHKANPKLLFFTIDDKQIDLCSNTYVSLRLNEDSVIEGSVLPDSYLDKDIEVGNSDDYKIKIQKAGNKHFFVYLKAGDCMDVLYAKVLSEMNLPIDKFKLVFDGHLVKHTDTVASLGVEQNDVFDVITL